MIGMELAANPGLDCYMRELFNSLALSWLNSDGKVFVSTTKGVVGRESL